MSNSETHLSMHATPIPRKLRSVDLKRSLVLMGGGIINPFGPSLTLVALEEQKASGKSTVLQIMLNPFSQWVNEVGKISIGETLTIEENIRPLFDLEWGSCPSWLLSSKFFSEPHVESIYMHFFASLQNGYRLLESVRKTPENPFERISLEIESFDIDRPPIQDRPLTEEEASELASHLLEPEANKKEMQAFLAAWDGAISFQKASRMKSMSVKKFLTLFAPLGLSCRIPQ